MSRSDYLQYRNTGNAVLLWEYYDEKYKGPNKIDINTFMQKMFEFPFKQQCFQTVCEEWDAKFNIMMIKDKNTGQLIKIY